MFGRSKDRGSQRPDAPQPARAVDRPAKTRPPAPASAPAPKPRTPATKGQLAYEARRAEKAGMGLEKWMAEKSRRVQEQRAAAEKAERKAKAAATAKPGLLRRLLDRAHKPL